MAGSAQGMDTNSSKSVSTFDLEPNPFEQSFASTKKPQASEFVVQQDGTKLQSTASKSINIEGYLGSTPANVTPGDGGMNGTVDNIQKHADGVERGKLSSLIYGSQRPNIHSPPIVTPGGAKRLPPILLSPTLIQHGSNNISNLNGVPAHHQLGNRTANGGIPANSNALNNNGESLKNSFFLGIPKTGLTPNESNMRTGLTPVLGTAHNMSHPPLSNLPSFSNIKLEGNVNELDNQKTINSTINSFGQMHSNFPTTDGGNQSDIAPLPSNLGSMLGLASNSVISQAPNPSGRQGNTDYENNSSIRSNAAIGGTNASPKQYKEFCAPASGASTKSRQRKSSNSMSPRQISSKRRKSSNSGKPPKPNKKNQAEYNDQGESENAGKDANDNSSEIYGQEDDQERKRKEFLERNRVAASKFRKRKKEYIKRVEVDLKFYESEYDDMSQAMNKLCGIGQVPATTNKSESLISMLETAIAKNDVPSSLSILAHIKQVLYETDYFKRNGRNPRRESAEQQSDYEERRRSLQEVSSKERDRKFSVVSSQSQQRKDSLENYQPGSLNSMISTSNQPPSAESNVSFGTDATTLSSSSKNDPAGAGLLSLSLLNPKEQSPTQVASAIGTISTLPDVINGTQVISMAAIPPESPRNIRS